MEIGITGCKLHLFGDLKGEQAQVCDRTTNFANAFRTFKPHSGH